MKSVSDFAQTITNSLKRMASRLTGRGANSHTASSGQSAASSKAS